MKFLVLLSLFFPLFAHAQQAGKFDYYVLNMSWSPEYCYNHRGSEECDRHLGLVVHGLWPQYNGAGLGPEFCGNRPGLSNPGKMLDIMPSQSLIGHEWAAHGTCSGLSPEDYFELLRKTFERFHVPGELQQPRRQTIIRAAQLRRDILQANPGLNESEIGLGCTGPYLRDVEICVSKDGRPQPCSGLHECRAPSLRIPPVR